MKSYLLITPLFLLLSSCSGWSEDSKRDFITSCKETTLSEGKDEAQAKSICDCRLEKIMKKYPDVEAALEHMNEIATDKEIMACQ